MSSPIDGHPYSGFSIPSYSSPPGYPSLQWPQQSPRPFARHPQRPAPSTNSFSSDVFGPETAVDETRHFQHLRTNEIQHPDVMVRRSMPYQRPYRQGSPDSNSRERRHSSRPADIPPPLPEVGSSPRNSNRRSFDRYSNDLPSGAHEANGPTRSLASRAAGTSVSAYSCTGVARCFV
jgi:hypothetical protein